MLTLVSYSLLTLLPSLSAGAHASFAPRAECSEVMKAIKDCHLNNPYLKFFGVCNDQKTALNMCLRKEVRRFSLASFAPQGRNLTIDLALQRQGKAVGNLEKAKAKRKEVEEKWKAIEEEA